MEPLLTGPPRLTRRMEPWYNYAMTEVMVRAARSLLARLPSWKLTVSSGW